MSFLTLKVYCCLTLIRFSNKGKVKAIGCHLQCVTYIENTESTESSIWS